MFTEKMACQIAEGKVVEMPAESTSWWYLTMAVMGDRRAESTPRTRAVYFDWPQQGNSFTEFLACVIKPASCRNMLLRRFCIFLLCPITKRVAFQFPFWVSLRQESSSATHWFPVSIVLPLFKCSCAWVGSNKRGHRWRAYFWCRTVRLGKESCPQVPRTFL